MAVILRLFSMICLIYYVIIVAYAGFGAAFSPVWLILAISSLILSFVSLYLGSMPKPLQYILLIVVILGGLLFAVVEGMIIREANKKSVPNAEYMIILGARVKGSVPSKTLHERIQASTRYLLENKETIVIVSGGQGPGEDISEAAAMGSALISNGIDKSRIIFEDQSTNTEENIRFSKENIADHNVSIVISTSDFHVYRGIQIAKRQGLTNVSGCPSKPDQILTINYYLREFFAIVKDKLMGNI